MRTADNLVLLSLLSSASAACTRDTLLAARDTFWKKETKLAPTVKIGFNNILQTKLDTTPYVNITTNKWTPFTIQAVDTETCNVATFRVSPTSLLSARLAVDASGAISEVELLQAVSGDQFFRPSGFPNKEPEIMNAKLTPAAPVPIPKEWTENYGLIRNNASVDVKTCNRGVGAPRLLTRKELAFTASSYADGLYGTPFSSCVLGGTTCPRIENGVQTTSACGVGTGMFGFDVKNRRWVVDVDTGVVLGSFYFDYSGRLLKAISPVNLFLHEYFKVEAGGLRYVWAPMTNLKGEVVKKDIWGGLAPPS